MTTAKVGDKVKVHYTGKLENGELFDTSKGREPLEFTIGTEKIIPGFQNGVIGMEAGETKTVTVAPDEGYGPWNEKLTMDVDKNDLSSDIEPQVGQCLRIPRQEGNDVIVTITDMKDESVTLDANHPLAGKTLTFELELVEIT